MPTDVVAVTLAHPLGADDAAELGAVDVRDYLAGQAIAVPRSQVTRLAASGYVAGVDPGDQVAVRALLRLPALQLGPGRPVGALFTALIPGPLTVQAGARRYYNDTGRTLRVRVVRASVDTAPQGGPVRINVRRNGTSVWSTPDAQPTIPAGATTAAATPTEDRDLLPSGAYLTFDVDAVGGDAPGDTLNVTVTVEDFSSFVGQPGHTPALFSGPDAPVGLATDGDLYLQENGNLYQQQGGTWALAGNLRGPSGEGAGITINGVAGTVFTLDAAAVGAETPAGAQDKANTAAAAAAAASVPRDSTAQVAPAAPLWRHGRASPVTEDSTPIAEFDVDGQPTAWLNGWGGYRARPATGGDTPVRLWAHPMQSANVAEVITSADGRVLWAIGPDGRTLQGSGTGAPVVNAPVVVLATGEPVPDGIPDGTIIVRR